MKKAYLQVHPLDPQRFHAHQGHQKWGENAKHQRSVTWRNKKVILSRKESRRKLGRPWRERPPTRWPASPQNPTNLMTMTTTRRAQEKTPAAMTSPLPAMKTPPKRQVKLMTKKNRLQRNKQKSESEANFSSNNPPRNAIDSLDPFAWIVLQLPKHLWTQGHILLQYLDPVFNWSVLSGEITFEQNPSQPISGSNIVDIVHHALIPGPLEPIGYSLVFPYLPDNVTKPVADLQPHRLKKNYPSKKSQKSTITSSTKTTNQAASSQEKHRASKTKNRKLVSSRNKSSNLNSTQWHWRDT